MFSEKPIFSTPFAFNLPMIDACFVGPEKYQDEIVHGALDAHRALQKKWGPVSEATLEQLAAKARFRVIFRSTATYTAMIQQSCAAKKMQDGARWSIGFERIFRSPLRELQRPRAWPLWEHERDSLLNLEVPKFYFRAGETLVAPEGGPPVAGVFRSDSALRAGETISYVLSMDGALVEENIRAILNQAIPNSDSDRSME
jgi:lantibiotic modifying enzyme